MTAEALTEKLSKTNSEKTLMGVGYLTI